MQRWKEKKEYFIKGIDNWAKLNIRVYFVRFPSLWFLLQMVYSKIFGVKPNATGFCFLEYTVASIFSANAER